MQDARAGSLYGQDCPVQHKLISFLKFVQGEEACEPIECTCTHPHTEEDAQLVYDTETKDNQLETTTKTQDAKYKTKEAKDLDKSVNEATADRSGVQEELDSVNKYLDELHGECDEKVESYAERKERREKEIAGLKEGLSVLENEAALIQTKSRRSLRLRSHTA